MQESLKQHLGTGIVNVNSGCDQRRRYRRDAFIEVVNVERSQNIDDLLGLTLLDQRIQMLEDPALLGRGAVSNQMPHCFGVAAGDGS